MKTYLDVEALAERWKKPVATIYNMRYRGAGPPAVRVGNTLRFSLDAIEAWEREQERRDAARKPA